MPNDFDLDDPFLDFPDERPNTSKSANVKKQHPKPSKNTNNNSNKKSSSTAATTDKDHSNKNANRRGVSDEANFLRFEDDDLDNGGRDPNRLLPPIVSGRSAADAAMSDEIVIPDGRAAAASSSSSHKKKGQEEDAAATAPQKKGRSSRHGTYDSRSTGICFDTATVAHLCFFPCMVDGIYKSMNDDGFTCFPVTLQMFLCAPLYCPVCCCFQSYMVRRKFHIITDIEETQCATCCRAACFPCCITAEIHREMEVRHRPVLCCLCDARFYEAPAEVVSAATLQAQRRGGRLAAPRAPKMKVPFLTSADNGASLVVSPELTFCFCCTVERPVMYNSGYHCLDLGCGLIQTIFTGTCEGCIAVAGATAGA